MYVILGYLNIGIEGHIGKKIFFELDRLRGIVLFCVFNLDKVRGFQLNILKVKFNMAKPVFSFIVVILFVLLCNFGHETYLLILL